jgi:hypothetical protein
MDDKCRNKEKLMSKCEVYSPNGKKSSQCEEWLSEALE